MVMVMPERLYEMIDRDNGPLSICSGCEEFCSLQAVEARSVGVDCW